LRWRGGAPGGTQLTLTFGPDESGGLQTLVERFNKENRGAIQVQWREAPAASDEYFDQIRTELQSGSANVDVIAGDVVWPAQLAAAGYLLDLSDRFTPDMRGEHLEGPVKSVIYEGKAWGVPWFTDAGMLYYRKDLVEKSGFSGPPKTWAERQEMWA
jgi:multiple sugar transport system substrate-binding protein